MRYLFAQLVPVDFLDFTFTHIELEGVCIDFLIYTYIFISLFLRFTVYDNAVIIIHRLYVTIYTARWMPSQYRMLGNYTQYCAIKVPVVSTSGTCSNVDPTSHVGRRLQG
jgi:hypothetical protein